MAYSNKHLLLHMYVGQLMTSAGLIYVISSCLWGALMLGKPGWVAWLKATGLAQLFTAYNA